jgi:predicted amino acid dehydrogenase
VHLSARADKDIAEMDMIVTATSGAGKKVLDIMKVKPGCVITDVARPLDLPPERCVRVRVAAKGRPGGARRATEAVSAGAPTALRCSGPWPGA